MYRVTYIISSLFPKFCVQSYILNLKLFSGSGLHWGIHIGGVFWILRRTKKDESRTRREGKHLMQSLLCDPDRFPACADIPDLAAATPEPALGCSRPDCSRFNPHSSCSHVPQPGRHTPTHILVFVTQNLHLPRLVLSLSHSISTGSKHCMAQRSLHPGRCAAALGHDFSWEKKQPS